MPNVMMTTEQGRQLWLQRRIESGELVSNAPFRERYLWLLENDEDFSPTECCKRLASFGFPSYMRKRKKHPGADTSRLQRNLGLRPQSPTSRGRRAGERGFYSQHIRYEFAVALCRAMEMDPVDCGV